VIIERIREKYICMLKVPVSVSIDNKPWKTHEREMIIVGFTLNPKTKITAPAIRPAAISAGSVPQPPWSIRSIKTVNTNA
jgi:hypothetical protein